MKKEYVAPKAEKMDFDYEENVVASNVKAGKNNINACMNNKKDPNNLECLKD